MPKNQNNLVLNTGPTCWCCASAPAVKTIYGDLISELSPLGLAGLETEDFVCDECFDLIDYGDESLRGKFDDI